MTHKLLLMLVVLFMVMTVNAQDLTPAQQEGPYYPVEKPADTDSNLTVVADSNTVAAGDLVVLDGTLVDTNGQPVAGAVIEIWQTDTHGIYMHPNDPDTTERDMNFQFYGETVTTEEGHYEFRTILPGQYEPRPRHIHFKVKLNTQTYLTSQFYFDGYTDAPSSNQPAALTVTLQTITDEKYPVAYKGTKTIIINPKP